jgi:zinc resistance-associated protein
MWKAVLAGTTALAIAGTSLVYAQQRGRPDGGQRWRPTMEDMHAFADARLAALHAGLELSPDQEKNWPAFEQASKEFAKLRLDRISAKVAARRDGNAQPNDPADRLHKRATAMTETGAALKKLADATDPLYKTLDDGQKHRFAMLSHMGGRREGGQGDRGQGDRGREFHGRDDGGRDGGGPRRFEGGPRRTELQPQGAPRGESL